MNSYIPTSLFYLFDSDENIYLRILLSRREASAAIGLQGLNLKYYQEKEGIEKFLILKKPIVMPNLKGDYQLLKIKGNPKAVFQIIKEISENNNNVYLRVLLSRREAAVAIGVKGETLKCFKAKEGITNLEILKEPVTAPYLTGNYQLLKIKGNPQDVFQVMKEILSLK